MEQRLRLPTTTHALGSISTTSHTRMRSSMSGSAAPGGGDHGDGRLLYGDQQPAADSVPSCGNDDELDSVFFRSSASGGADYSSITDYLQGLLDPAGLASHLDAPPTVGDVIGFAAAPGTPKSSTSGEASDELLRRCKGARPPVEGDQGGEVDDEGSTHHQNFRSDTKEKEKKGKGKGEKKSRGSRVAFATKSEVDHLDDGYRWRKYGQKAVKNSSFPRSYYRCTTAQCGVKKLVERSQQDPSTVVTTYEGRHAHPSPVAAHRGAHMLMAVAATDIYSSASLQHHQYGFCPTDADTYAHMCMQPTTMAHQLSEYGGMQLHADVLPSAVIGYQHGHR